MASFRFKDSIDVIIEGNKYTINLKDKKIVNAVSVLAESSAEMATGNELTEQALGNYINICKEFIHVVLGANAFEEIFSAREIVLTDLIELCSFICNEINAEKEKRFSYYSGKE